MSKDLKQPKADVTTNEETLLPAAPLGKVEGLSRADAFKLMEDAEDGQLQNLNSEYFKLETVGERVVMLFTAMTTFKGDNGEVEAVTLEDAQGKTFICPTAVIVSALKKVTHMPAYCRLTFNGEKKNNKGQKYQDFTVEVFPEQTK